MPILCTPAHDLSYDNICGSWKIDDIENSFFTQPFWIKYARQDVYLTIMISFDLSLNKREVRVLSNYIPCVPNVCMIPLVCALLMFFSNVK